MLPLNANQLSLRLKLILRKFISIILVEWSESGINSLNDHYISALT